MGEISAGVASLKAAADLLKAMVGLRDTAMVSEQVAAVQRELLSVQSSMFDAHSLVTTLLANERELKEEVARLESWDAEKQQYELSQVANGAFAYTKKKGMECGEPPHWICPNCFAQHRKSFLQRTDHVKGRERQFACPSCRTIITVPWSCYPGSADVHSPG